MTPQTANPLDLFARQIATRYLDESYSELSSEHRQQLVALYHQAILKVFNEVVKEPEWVAPWHALKVATRAHAYTFGERHEEVLNALNLEPTLSVRNLCHAIEKVIGKDMLVLKRYAMNANIAQPAAAVGAPSSNVSVAPAPPPKAEVKAPKVTVNPLPKVAPGPVDANRVEAQPVEKEVERAMNPTNPKSPAVEAKFTDKLSAEANEAAWLIFASKSVELTQQSVAAFLQRNLADGDPALRARIGQLMETKLGEVLTALLLSGVASTFGSTVGDKVGVSQQRMEMLASKLRVHAIASGGKSLLDELIDPFLANLTELIRAMPEADQVHPPLLVGQQTRAPEGEQVEEKEPAARTA